MSEKKEKEKKSKARSVHLFYKCPGVTNVSCIYNEVTVKESLAGTYFCVIGFKRGYFGLQEKKRDRKVVIFSVWDPGSQNDHKSVPEENKCKVIDPGEEGTNVKRFGNEGTGGQSTCLFNWKLHETYKFLVEAVVDGEWTTFRGSFYDPECKKWRRLATFKTITRGILLQWVYSFVEDFSGSIGGHTIKRHALFGNCWFYKNSEWHHASKAKFTAAKSKHDNINAGCSCDRYFLESGGETGNDCSLNSFVTVPASTSKPENLVSHACNLDGLCCVSGQGAECYDAGEDSATPLEGSYVQPAEETDYGDLSCTPGAVVDEDDSDD